MDAITYTTADVAAARGCLPTTVAKAARRLKLGRKHGRDWAFTQDERDRLISEIRDGAGNPTFWRHDTTPG